MIRTLSKRECCYFCHPTRLVLFRIILLAAPIAAEKITPPARHMPTLITPESNGVIIGIIMNRSIPSKRLRQMDIQLLCLANTAMSRKIATNTAIRKILESMHMIRPATPAVPSVNGRPAMLPPSIPPRKKARRNNTPAIKQIMVLEAT